MTSAKRIASIVVAAACCSAFALSSVASASAPAPTTVKITAESDGFFGYVNSPKPGRCANNRTIKIFKQVGAKPQPVTVDQVYMTEVAEKQGNRYRWDTGNSGNVSGRYYARAAAIPGCRAGISLTVSQPPSD
jgi:hypothetical protein